MERSTFILLLVFLVPACSEPPSTAEPEGETTVIPVDRSPLSRYDRKICDASREFLPVPTKIFGCNLFKAQLYQESLLDPDARSPAGAEGIAQFMPGTWEEVMSRMGIASANPRQADIAIRAGAYYMMTLRAQWRKDREESDRMMLAQASYNAGLGSILRSQEICDDALDWAQIQPCLVRVTGRHSAETTTYIQRIWRYWKLWGV